MNLARKFLAILTLVALSCAHVNSAQAEVRDMNGKGYIASRGAPSLTPAIALGTIAVVAIVAVALQHTGGHSSTHAHSSSNSSD